MNNEADSYMSTLPTEVLLFIFSFLPAKDLTLCRRVCVRFRDIVDALLGNNALWRDYCKNDFEKVYKIARLKARVGLHQWFDIYRTLSLWPKLSQAKEVRGEFALASCVSEEIQNFKVLRDGIIGVHKKSGIVYYDIETLQKSERRSITGEYLKYMENDDTVVILGYQQHLYIIRKAIQNIRYETSVTFDNVKSFILIDKEIYYFTVDNEVYICLLEEGNYTHHLLSNMEESVLCFGYTDRLHILTLDQNIYSVYGQNLVHKCRIGPGMNLLHILREYNFLERMDWRVYIQWMYVLNHTILEGLWRDIAAVRMYGDIALVGSNWGTLHVYYAPVKDGEFDLLNLEPMKKYDFVEWCNCTMISMCPITQIDVLESVDGHTVIVSMLRKIAVLNFTHNFERPASVAVLLDSDE